MNAFTNALAAVVLTGLIAISGFSVEMATYDKSTGYGAVSSTIVDLVVRVRTLARRG